MKLIGILGGIGSGKSLVAAALAQRGAAVLDADRAGHLVLEEPEVRDALRARWGERVFGPDGGVNRKAIAGIVFGETPKAKEELAFLESVTHPRIGARIFEELERLRREGKGAVAVLDAPVMTKTGWHERCDELWWVECPKEERIRRVASRGWDAAKLEAYEAAQDPLDWRRSLCQVVIDNSGDKEATERQVEAELSRLLA